MRALPERDLDEITRGARDELASLRGARVLVTGATGFVGRWLLASFVHANRTLGLGAHCTALARRAHALADVDPALASEAAITLVDGDVRSWAPSSDVSFTHVIHAATSASTQLNDAEPLEMFATIVDGTRHVLALCERWKSERVLFTSSGAVYGAQPPSIERVSEEFLGGPDVLDRRNVYAEAKRVAELCCAVAVAQHGLPVAIARCFAFSGPLLPLDRHFAFGNFIHAALTARPIVVEGDGTPRRSYLYAGDLARWLWTMLVRAPAGRAYNVGSDVVVDIATLARSIGKVAGVPVEVRGVARSDVAPTRYVPSIDRARIELGLEGSITLVEAIERTLTWHAPHRAWRADG